MSKSKTKSKPTMRSTDTTVKKNNINTIVNTKTLNKLDTLDTFNFKNIKKIGTIAQKINPVAKIDDVRNDIRSRVHSVNPVSILRENRRQKIATVIQKYSDKDTFHSNFLKATICNARKIKKAMMIIHRVGGSGTPKKKNIFSDIKC